MRAISLALLLAQSGDISVCDTYNTCIHVCRDNH